MGQCLDPIGLLDKVGNLGFYSMSAENPFVDFKQRSKLMWYSTLMG